MVKLIQSETLKSNLDRLVNKINHGFFNNLIIFGPTRSGKSTLAVQIGCYLSQKIGVSFSNDDIFFDAGKMIKVAQIGKNRKVYVLDEAAFDLMGEDWQNKFQKMLIKIFMVAAKYNQTFILLIPKLEKLREFFISDEHTRAIQVYYNKKTLERGFFKAFSGQNLNLLYDALRNKRYWKLKDIRPDFNGRFNKRINYIDIDRYNKEKDDAIKNLGNKEKQDKYKIILVKLAMILKNEYKIPYKKISRQIGKNANYFSQITKETHIKQDIR